MKRKLVIRGLVLMVLVLGGGIFGFFQLTKAFAATSITISGSGGGRTFDGIGAISGGGGNTRLLIDYPEPYRSQILDYLFKPGYGAAVQILKVEVGGDTNSTDGSESSYMHTANTQEWNSGYEWWLMQQAKARNPNIKLFGLAWGAPGWIGTTGAPVYDPNNRFWSQDMVNYYINWIKGAQSHYNLTIDYIGGWNERGFNKQFFEALQSAIQSNGLSTKVVAADSDWSVADAMVSDSTFNNAVNIVGTHYPCGYLSSETTCNSTGNAMSLNKPLWASENGSQDYNGGAGAMARADNRDYLDGKMTATINWPIVASLYPDLPFGTDGLILANQPWSGNYSVGKQAWVTAQTTQFTAPGWQYIDSASGYLGGNRNNGSYVTLKSPNGSDYSVIIETMDASSSQTANFQVTGGLSTGTVHVWSTNVNSNNPSDYFVHQSDITPSNGAYSLTLQPGFVYSTTTTTGQGKGTASGPASGSFGLPYSDNFDTETVQQDAKYFSDMNGAFEVQSCGGGRSGQCLRQMDSTAPINWETPSDPYTLIGDLGWANYTVSADVLLEQPGHVVLMGRYTSQTRNPGAFNAYEFQVTNGGNWSILRNSTSGSATTLASGNATALGTNSWHTLSLGFQGSTITAQIDHNTVGTVTDSTYNSGLAGLGVSGWQNAQFDNFSVGGSTTVIQTYYLVNRNSGKVMDVNGASTSNGASVIQYTNHQGLNQQWQEVNVGGGYVELVNVNSGLALEVPNASTSQGTQLDQWSYHGGTNQQWQLVSAGGGYYTIVNRNSGMLADVSGRSTADSAPVIQWPSNGGTNQQWQLVPVG